MLREANKPLPIEDYEKMYYLLQAIYFDFDRWQEIPEEKVKTLALACNLMKSLYEEKCKKELEAKGITDNDLSDYSQELMRKSLI